MNPWKALIQIVKGFFISIIILGLMPFLLIQLLIEILQDL